MFVRSSCASIRFVYLVISMLLFLSRMIPRHLSTTIREDYCALTPSSVPYRHPISFASSPAS